MPKQQEIKLRECPFCLNKKISIIILKGDYWVGCDKCGIGMYSDNRDFLYKSWNTRHEPEHKKYDFPTEDQLIILMDRYIGAKFDIEGNVYLAGHGIVAKEILKMIEEKNK